MGVRTIKDKPHAMPIGAKMVAKMLEAAGATRTIVTMDLHAGQDTGLF